MFKKVNIVVWTAFIFWTVIFVFSVSQAQTGTVSSTATVAAPKPPPNLDPVADMFKTYVDFLCGNFKQTDSCKAPVYQWINDANKKAHSLPTSVNGIRSYTLYITMQICGSSINKSAPSDQERARCFLTADQGLAGDNGGNHPECQPRGFKLSQMFLGRDYGSYVACYKKAFAADYAQSQIVVKTNKVFDPTAEYFKGFAAELCHKMEGFKPEPAIGKIPDDFQGLFIPSRNLCEKIEAQWAARELPKMQGTQPATMGPAEKAYLEYRLIGSVCLDKIQSQKPGFSEKCFYSEGLYYPNNDGKHLVDYTACLSPDVIPEDDHSEDAVNSKAIALNNVIGVTDKDYFLKCYKNAFNEETNLLLEQLKAEQEYTAEKQAAATASTALGAAQIK